MIEADNGERSRPPRGLPATVARSTGNPGTWGGREGSGWNNVSGRAWKVRTRPVGWRASVLVPVPHVSAPRFAVGTTETRRTRRKMPKRHGGYLQRPSAALPAPSPRISVLSVPPWLVIRGFGLVGRRSGYRPAGVKRTTAPPSVATGSSRVSAAVRARVSTVRWFGSCPTSSASRHTRAV